MVGLAALSLAFAPAAYAAPAAASGAAVAVGSVTPVPAGAKAAAAPSASKVISIDVALAPRNASLLRTYATEVSDPKSAYYRQFLTPTEYDAYFAPTQATVDAVESALRADGLTVGDVQSDHLTIPMTGTVAQVEKAFGVQFNGYRLSTGRQVYAAASAPKVPASIAADISGVLGLDDIIKPHAGHISAHPAVASKPLPAGTKAGKAATARPQASAPGPMCSTFQSAIDSYLSSFGSGTVDSQNYYEPTALSQALGINQQWSAGNLGAGTTVALLEWDSNPTAAVNFYLNCYGLTNPVTYQNVDGGPTVAADGGNNGTEFALDVEAVASVAPGASVISYQGPNDASLTDAQVLDTINAAVSADKAQAISASYGFGCENNAAANPTFISAESTIYETAAAQGQSFFVSTGDSGSTECFNSTGLTSTVSPSDPASQPFVTGVGGTSMTGTTAPSLGVWNDSSSQLGAGGGGESQLWAESTGAGWYQAGFTAPGYASSDCAATAGKVCRQSPDLSTLADPLNGLAIAVEDDSTNSLGAVVEGGTSLASPIMAAVTALADSSSTCTAAHTMRLGLLNPALYSLASTSAYAADFTDITTGDNDYTPSGYVGGNYAAGTGYDMATGLGSPNDAVLIPALCSQTASGAGYYIPAGPARLLDTRKGIGAPKQPVAASTGIDLQVTGTTANGVTIPASGVSAVVLNLTAVNETAPSGHITAFPAGAPMPATSSLNFTAGTVVPNLAIVPIGQNGKVTLFNGSGGTTDLIADVQGYFTTSSAAAGASTYDTLTPTRILDTRKNIGTTSGALVAGSVDTLPVTGTNGIPANATALDLNITVTKGTGSGYITAYPDGTTPSGSNVNFTAGQTVANQAIIPIGRNGSIDFAFGGGTGTVQLIADVSGYFVAGTGGAVFHPLDPQRVIDTRKGIGTAQAQLPSNGTLAVDLGVAYPGLVPAAAVVANLTVTKGTAPTDFITAYPGSLAAPPTVSNINFTQGQTLANLAIIPNGDGTIDFFNESGNVDLIMDVSGFFSTVD